MVIEITDFSSSLGDTLSPLLKAVNVLSEDGTFTPQNFNVNALGEMVKDNSKIEQLLEFIGNALPEPLIYFKSASKFTFKDNSSDDTIEEEWYQIIQGNANHSTPTLYATVIRAGIGNWPQETYQLGLGASMEYELASGIQFNIRFSIPLLQMGDDGFKAMLWNESQDQDPFSRMSVTIET